MRLKKLEILGFKSFAEKAKLTFHAGITAVVGPNGCGKSNIADAFRWVLGEQSAKSMRGNKMADVIFAGTAQRKPLNFAEATIVLEGVAGKLPIEYDEVAITRRMHRSGESEYFINRHSVRLKDVQSLFLDSGIGKDAYSIFEQGKIDQVINLSPIERRYIFEEAAGILRFLQRKKEALRKLEQADLNVSRVKDIHQEVEKQIIVLEKQAEQARRYKKDKQELEILEKMVILSKWDHIHKQLAENRRKSALIEGQINDGAAQIESLRKQLAEAKSGLENAEKALRVKSEEVYQARSAKEITTKEQKSCQERAREFLAKEAHWQKELEDGIAKAKQRQNDRHELEKTHQQQSPLLKELEAEVKIYREKTAALDGELNDLRRRYHTKQQEHVVNLKAESQYESELKQAHVRLENAQARQSHIHMRKSALSNDLQRLSIQIEENKVRLAEASKLIDSQKERFAELENNLKELSEEESKTQKQYNAIHTEITEAKARQKVLQRLREDLEGFSNGSKKLLQEASKPSSPFFNKIRGLYEYISPKPGSEQPLASFLKFYAQTLVVETEEEFSKVMAFAKQHALTELSILCIEALQKLTCGQPSQEKRHHLSPLLLLSIENKLSNHFLRNAYQASTLDEAFNAVLNDPGTEVLTPDGIFIDRRCVLFFGVQGTSNAFLREAELNALIHKLQEKENEKQHLEAALKAVQQKRTQIQSERIELDKAIRRDEMKLIEINFGLQKTQADLEKARSEEKTLNVESSAVASSIENFSASITEVQKKLTQAKNKVLEDKSQAESLNELLEVRAAGLKLESRSLQEKTGACQKAAEENQKRLHALHVLDIKDQEAKLQQKRLEDEIETGRLMLTQIMQKEAEAAKLLKEAEHMLGNVSTACLELEQDTAVRKGAIEHLEGKINDRRHLLKKCETEQGKNSIHTAQFESTLQSLESELQERHHLDIEGARAICPSPSKSIDELEKQARSLRQQLENSGDINMASIEECDKHKERYHFLNQQIDDLALSKQELVQIIAGLDKESRTIFKATFDQICINFKKNFNILFNGGEADLQFTETSDVLEAGIEIIAKPPGKQMRSISLLSGGEKCLTAVALLFAIFEVKPSPFCILDEIDAPLDDTNVERFVSIVKEFADRCQFIIITHNKRTMAIADVIFGVSMEEKGVSKLLSMDFTEQNNSAGYPQLVS